LTLAVVVATGEGSLDWAGGSAGSGSADGDTAARLDQALSSLWAVAGGVADLEVSAPGVLEAEGTALRVGTTPAVESSVTSGDKVTASLWWAERSWARNVTGGGEWSSGNGGGASSGGDVNCRSNSGDSDSRAGLGEGTRDSGKDEESSELHFDFVKKSVIIVKILFSLKRDERGFS